MTRRILKAPHPVDGHRMAVRVQVERGQCTVCSRSEVPVVTCRPPARPRRARTRTGERVTLHPMGWLGVCRACLAVMADVAEEE